MIFLQTGNKHLYLYMYRIFVNDKPIFLNTVVEKETDFKNFLLKDANMETVLQTLSKKKVASVRLIHHNEDTILKKFLNSPFVILPAPSAT